jgi:glycosyltransferase involved in cell wall biosynthesis
MEFTGRYSIVIYPPVDTGLFVPSDERLDYYLSYARLSTIKRIDVIVRAFQQMPDKKLIIHYGINDPQRREIEALIIGYPNIELIHLDTQEELRDKIARSLAVVYVPEDEDF